MLLALQEIAKKTIGEDYSTKQFFENQECQNKISEYYKAEIKSWCLYKYSEKQVNTIFHFFEHLNGRCDFTYEQYNKYFQKYEDSVLERDLAVLEEMNSANKFLQLLFDTNMICYYEIDENGRKYFRYSYREKSIYHLEPQVKFNVNYSIHPALRKNLNVGKILKNQ